MRLSDFERDPTAASDIDSLQRERILAFSALEPSITISAVRNTLRMVAKAERVAVQEPEPALRFRPAS
jgi:hypothetical protein